MESAFARTRAFLTKRIAALVDVEGPGVVCRDLGDEVRAVWSGGTIEVIDDGEPVGPPATSENETGGQSAGDCGRAPTGEDRAPRLRLLSPGE